MKRSPPEIPKKAAVTRAPEFKLLGKRRQQEMLEYLAEGDDGDNLASVAVAQAQQTRNSADVDRLKGWALTFNCCDHDAFSHVIKKALDEGRIDLARTMLERARARYKVYVEFLGAEWEVRVLIAEGALEKAEAICARKLKEAPHLDQYRVLRATIRTGTKMGGHRGRAVSDFCPSARDEAALERRWDAGADRGSDGVLRRRGPRTRHW